MIERGWAKEIVTTNQTSLNQNSNSSRTLPNPIAGLGNDIRIVNCKNQTYYFETPNDTKTVDVRPVQISFHDVIFTLFPSTFGGMSFGSCEGMHYVTDTKFSDGTSELLHVFVVSPSCSYDYTPIKLSTHTNPQAVLTVYDGKMKLLVSNTLTNSLETKNSKIETAKFEVRNHDVSQRVDCVSFSEPCHFSETDYFSGYVEQVKTGLPIQVSISDPYDMLLHNLIVPSTNIASDGSFNFTYTFHGKFGQDIYTLDFTYGHQKYELQYTPVPPLQR